MNVFGPVRMCSDAFGCNRTRLSTLGGVLTLLEILGFLFFFRKILRFFGCFLTWGVNYYAEIRVQELTISGAYYSEPPLRAFENGCQETFSFVRPSVRSSFVRCDFFVDAQIFLTTRKIGSTRLISSKNRQNRSHPRDRRWIRPM